MPTLKKSIKAVRDALKKAEKQTRRECVGGWLRGYTPLSPYDHAIGKLDGLKLAQRIIDGIFPQ